MTFLTQFGGGVGLSDLDISAIPEPNTGLLACLGPVGLSAAAVGREGLRV